MVSARQQPPAPGGLTPQELFRDFAAEGDIALFGGSFDPPHIAHLFLAEQVAERFGVGKVWFAPAHHSPLKDGGAHAPDEDRLAMVRLATEGNPAFAVTDAELRRGGVSYTVDTLRALRRVHPHGRILFVAGMDSLLTLYRWREPLALLDLCEFVTFRRPGSPTPSPPDLHLPEPYASRLLAHIFDGRLCDVSSTEIRSRVADGRSIRYLVPDAVADYIAAHRLYR